MYKVFIYEVPVFFTEKHIDNISQWSVEFQELDFQQFFMNIENKTYSKINIICEDIDKDWLSFLKYFEIRQAAGGLVRNTKDEFLWIRRFGKWDLPKGHIEQGESKETAAIREVEEECGVGMLSIVKSMETTYHVFTHRNKKVMKITYWFEMKTAFKGKLIPQIEEGIEEVVYFDKKASKNCLNNTYENIKLLLAKYL